MRPIVAPRQKDAFCSYPIGLRVGTAFGQLRIMGRCVVAHLPPFAFLVNRKDDRPKRNAANQINKPFHALKVSARAPNSKIGAYPCWS